MIGEQVQGFVELCDKLNADLRSTTATLREAVGLAQVMQDRLLTMREQG